MRGFAITGPIGSGKSTLALRLARDYGALLLSSDGIRESLPGDRRRSGRRVFGVMRQTLDLALLEARPFILDSTGMSARFRALLHAHRASLVHVHLLLQDSRLFEERERTRTDRPSGPLPHSAFKQSQRVQFYEPPDLVIATDAASADDVYRLVTCHQRSGPMGGGTP